MMSFVPSLYPQYAQVGFWGGLAVLVAGLILIGWSLVHRTKGEQTAMGDTYNNSGNNFGHMGPVHIGRQQFEFTSDIAAELLAKVPKNKAIDVEIIGSQRSQQIGQNIVGFLRANGYSISEVITIGMKVPPPSGPLSLEGNTLTIAADL